ncbi:MAG: ABC transporter ATP-binding protein [Planctomycetaceae bacterium]
MIAIDIENLSKSYGRRRGIDDVSLKIQAGRIFGFLGPNGAGKSTAIRILLGFLKAGHGTARVLGHDCWSASACIKRDVGYVAGDVRLYSWLTARKAFRIVSQIRGTDLQAEGNRLTERFRLEPDLPVRKMSRGNRQKLALVMALAHRPRLVILDEPTSGLDPLMQDVLADCLREMAADGRTVFFSSHTLSEVESLCDDVAIIRSGRIVANDTLHALKARAPRMVSLVFDSEECADKVSWPDFLTPDRRFRNGWQLTMQGPSRQLVTWAATQPIADMSISPPSLDALFRGFYRDEE